MIDKLFEVMKEYPDYDVKFFVGNEELSDHIYTSQKITSIRIEPWIEYEDQIFTDYDCFLEHIVDILEIYPSDEDAMKDYPESKYKDVIVVRLGV